MDSVTLEEALKKAEVFKRAKNDASKYTSSTGPQSSLHAIKSERPNNVSEFLPEDSETTKGETSQVAATSRPFKSSDARLLICQHCWLQHAKAFGKTCFNCGKLNHWSKSCKQTRNAVMNSIRASLRKKKYVCNASVLEPSMIDKDINGK